LDGVGTQRRKVPQLRLHLRHESTVQLAASILVVVQVLGFTFCHVLIVIACVTGEEILGVQLGCSCQEKRPWGIESTVIRFRKTRTHSVF